jgi:hypothetical protein
MVEAVLALFLITVVRGRRELRVRGDVLGMAVRQIHPHLHVLDLRRFERIEVGVIYPDLPRLTRLNSPRSTRTVIPSTSEGLWAFRKKGIADARCRLGSIEAPALKAPTRKCRSRAFQG